MSILIDISIIISIIMIIDFIVFIIQYLIGFPKPKTISSLVCKLTNFIESDFPLARDNSYFLSGENVTYFSTYFGLIFPLLNLIVIGIFLIAIIIISFVILFTYIREKSIAYRNSKHIN